jgi:hypothetical protein
LKEEQSSCDERMW